MEQVLIVVGDQNSTQFYLDLKAKVILFIRLVQWCYIYHKTEVLLENLWIKDHDV